MSISKFLFISTWVLVLSMSNNNILVVNAELNGTCLTETELLLQDPSLTVAQSIIFQDYNASYLDVCSFGLTDLGCDISFEGDDRTYTALCEDSLGGQLYQRPVVLSCAFGSIQYHLGFVPTCVGASCNISDVEPNDVITDQVQSFLNNLTFTGCSAEGADETSSSATRIIAPLGGFSTAVLVPMILLSVGISALFES